MSKVALCVEKLIKYSQDRLLAKEEDADLLRNRLLAFLKLSAPENPVTQYGDFQTDILNPILEYAIDNQLCTRSGLVNFETVLISLVMPLPSVVSAYFDDLVVDEGIESALNWLYRFSKDCNYIRMVDVNKNIMWGHTGPYGDVDTTINIAKPEKDPAEIARLAKLPAAGYPSCMLCKENVGFYGTEKHPSRATLRTIPIVLGDEPWLFQFSPYSYYDQHCIALSAEHRKMQVDAACIRRLTDFVEIFPHYFIGSNAALPIVGGSILAHDHYQGGKKLLPLFKAKSRLDLIIEAFPNVKVCIVNWYNSVIRLSSLNKQSVINAAVYVMDKWKEYSDESANIIAKTDAPHNAVTPIVRLEEKEYVVDLILRNNRTTAEYPYGIFHPTEDLHNIKKEGIGLIEAMGLFILPGRLSDEVKVINEYLTGKRPFVIEEVANPQNPISKHFGLISQLIINQNGKKVTEADADIAITDYINAACERILECTAVFKNTEEGQRAFKRFLLQNGINVLGAYQDGIPVTDVQVQLKKEMEQAQLDKEAARRKLEAEKAFLKQHDIRINKTSGGKQIAVPKDTDEVGGKKPKSVVVSEIKGDEDNAPKKRGRPKAAAAEVTSAPTAEAEDNAPKKRGRPKKAKQD